MQLGLQISPGLPSWGVVRLQVGGIEIFTIQLTCSFSAWVTAVRTRCVVRFLTSCAPGSSPMATMAKDFLFTHNYTPPLEVPRLPPRSQLSFTLPKKGKIGKFLPFESHILQFFANTSARRGDLPSRLPRTALISWSELPNLLLILIDPCSSIYLPRALLMR